MTAALLVLTLLVPAGRPPVAGHAPAVSAERALVVDVEHPDGSPAERIWLLIKIAGPNGPVWDWKLRTDRHGSTRLPSDALEAGFSRLPEADRDRYHLTVAMSLPMEGQVPLTLTREEALSRRWTLTLPATSRVEVRVVTESGEDFPDPVRVTLSRERLGLHRVEFLWKRDRDWRRTARFGLATIPHVECGLRCFITVEDPARRYATVTLDGWAEHEPGGTKTFTAKLVHRRPRLTARISGPDGSPWSRSKVRVRLVDARGLPIPGFEDGEIVGTDEEGRITVVPPESWTGVAGRRGQGVVRLGVDAEGEGEPLVAEAELTLPLRPGETQLPDVQLKAAPVLLSGTVRATDGRPFPRARVTVQVPDADLPGTWRDEFETTTDRQGAFGVNGVARVGGLRVTVTHPFFAPAWFDVRPGATIAATLARGGGVEGRLLAHADAPLRDLAVSWVVGARRQSVPVSDGGRFAAYDLVSGAGKLVASIVGGDDALLERHLVVEPGRVVRDGLSSLSLTASCSVMEIRAERPDGRVLVGAEVAVSRGKSWHLAATDGTGVARLLAPRGRRHVTVAHPHLTRSAVWTSEDRLTVRLGSPGSLRVGWGEGVMRPAEGESLALTLTPRGDHPAPPEDHPRSHVVEVLSRALQPRRLVLHPVHGVKVLLHAECTLDAALHVVARDPDYPYVVRGRSIGSAGSVTVEASSTKTVMLTGGPTGTTLRPSPDRAP